MSSAARRCPACGQVASPELVRERDEATLRVIAEKWRCRWCKAELPPEESSPAAVSAAASDHLAAVLGGNDAPNVPRWELSDADRRFCCNCRHCAGNAFILRCLLTLKETDPMSECGDFELRQNS